MGEEITRILKLLENGKINSEEAERLIKAVSEKKTKGFYISAPPKIPKEFMMKVEMIPEQIGKAVSAAFGSVGTSGGKKTFHGVDNLFIKAVNGDVQLIPSDGETIIDGTGWPMRTIVEDNILNIDSINANFTAYVKPRSTASLNLVSTDLKAKKLDLETSIESVSGNIFIEKCSGRWDIRSISGNIELIGITGIASLETKSGNISMEIESKGRYICKTLSGNMDVVVPKGYVVSLKLDSPFEDVDLPEELEFAKEVKPENADIIIELYNKNGYINVTIK
ncbi:hypothetical protein KAH81_01875 [bacterium]|nr:hypothetical protein [bacterium]